MKSTTFNPLVLAMDLESAISLFEMLGFEMVHCITVLENGIEITNYCMKDSADYTVDLARVEGLPDDITFINFDVDEEDEEYEKLMSRNMMIPMGDHKASVRIKEPDCMISTSGFSFDICQ